MTVAAALAWTPRGELPRFQTFYPALRDIYAHIIVGLRQSDATPDILSALDALGVEVTFFEEYSGRHTVVARALEADADAIHYIDFDRAVRWIETRPEELAATVEALTRVDTLIIGRTDDAYATHPRALMHTEMLVNRVFSHHFERGMDFCAGSRGLRRRAAHFILANSPSNSALRMDGEWAVLCQRGGFTIGQVQVEGLDWESADQFQAQAADRARQQQMADAYDADPAHWALRVRVAHEIIDFGLDALTRPLNGDITS